MFAGSVFTYAVLHDILFHISGRENRKTTGSERWYHAEELHVCDVMTVQRIWPRRRSGVDIFLRRTAQKENIAWIDYVQ